MTLFLPLFHLMFEKYELPNIVKDWIKSDLTCDTFNDELILMFVVHFLMFNYMILNDHFSLLIPH